MARRPLDKIIEDIVLYLHPLKAQAVNPRPAIRHAVEEIAKDDLVYLRNANKICKRAREADIALAKLEELFPFSIDSKIPPSNDPKIPPSDDPKIPQKIHRFRLWLQAVAKTKGPDPRMNITHWRCANEAFHLVDQFSEKRPVTTQNEPWHLIAQFLFEAATGKPPSEVGLLRAVKRVARFLKNYS